MGFYWKLGFYIQFGNLFEPHKFRNIHLVNWFAQYLDKRTDHPKSFAKLRRDHPFTYCNFYFCRDNSCRAQPIHLSFPSSDGVEHAIFLHVRCFTFFVFCDRRFDPHVLCLCTQPFVIALAPFTHNAFSQFVSRMQLIDFTCLRHDHSLMWARLSSLTIYRYV